MFPIRDHNPSTRTPYVTWVLIAANLLVFAFTWPVGENYSYLWYQLALHPAAVSHGADLSGLFTHMFVHAGVMHIAGNMLFLWVFGDNLEDQLGHVRFTLFYLAGGLAAAFAQIAADPNTTAPMVGASGAIAGVMGGYLLLFPKARVDVLLIFIIFFKIIPVPAWIVLGFWFGIQLFNGVSSDIGSGVAYWAHAGGFVAGALLVVPLWLRKGGAVFWGQTHGKPPHPDTHYTRTTIPIVPRKKRF